MADLETNRQTPPATAEPQLFEASSPAIRRIVAQRQVVSDLLAEIARPSGSRTPTIPAEVVDQVTLSVSHAASAAREAVALLRIVTSAVNDGESEELTRQIGEAVAGIPNPSINNLNPQILETALDSLLRGGTQSGLRKIDIIIYEQGKPKSCQQGVSTVGELIQIPIDCFTGVDAQGARAWRIYRMGPGTQVAIARALRKLDPCLSLGMSVSDELLQSAGIPRIVPARLSYMGGFEWKEYKKCDTASAKKWLTLPISELGLASVREGRELEKAIAMIEIQVETEKAPVYRKINTIGELVQVTDFDLSNYAFNDREQRELGLRQHSSLWGSYFDLSYSDSKVREIVSQFVNMLLSRELSLGATLPDELRAELNIPKVLGVRKLPK